MGSSGMLTRRLSASASSSTRSSWSELLTGDMGPVSRAALGRGHVGSSALQVRIFALVVAWMVCFTAPRTQRSEGGSSTRYSWCKRAG